MIRKTTTLNKAIEHLNETWNTYHRAVTTGSSSALEAVTLGQKAYELHGSPFGHSWHALAVWMRFMCRSTPN